MVQALARDGQGARLSLVTRGAQATGPDAPVKVQGTLNLHRLTTDDPLDFFALCPTTRCGRRWRRRPACRWRRWPTMKLMRDHALPLVRADVTAVETWDYVSGPPLECPIAALCGDQDPIAPPAAMLGFADETRGRFALHRFAGGHMFVNRARGAVLEAVRAELLGNRPAAPGGRPGGPNGEGM